jgi:hypothetical protein
VLVHGRDRRRIEATLEELCQSATGEAPRGDLADLSSLAEVRRLASEVGEREQRLDRSGQQRRHRVGPPC